MKFAFYPGCVALGAGKELYTSTRAIAQELGIELEEMTSSSCCGAGVIDEESVLKSDALNARTFAIAEEKGNDILTICGTCQGVMRKAENKLNANKNYKQKVNEILKDGGHQYQGEKIKIKHLMSYLADKNGLDLLKKKIKKPLKKLKIAPFYGCYILRTSDYSDLKNPDNPTEMEDIISTLGGIPVNYPLRLKCCGFPVAMMNKQNMLKMSGNALISAKENGADCMVTVCPLCQLSLDGYQPEIDSLFSQRIDLPVLHLSQLIGIALDVDPKELRLANHIVSATRLTAL